MDHRLAGNKSCKHFVNCDTRVQLWSPVALAVVNGYNYDTYLAGVTLRDGTAIRTQQHQCLCFALSTNEAASGSSRTFCSCIMQRTPKRGKLHGNRLPDPSAFESLVKSMSHPVPSLQGIGE